MNNFELHAQATELSEFRSAYSLAREVLVQKAEQGEAVAAGIRTALRNLGDPCLTEEDIAEFARQYVERS